MEQFDKIMKPIYTIGGVVMFVYLLSQLNSSHLWILEGVYWVIGIFLIWMIFGLSFDFIKAKNKIKNYNKRKKYYNLQDFEFIINGLSFFFAFLPNSLIYRNNLRKHIGELDPLTKYFLISEGFDIESPNSFHKINRFWDTLVSKYEIDLTTEVYVIHIVPETILCLLDISYSKDSPPTESQISILKDKLADDNFKKKIMSSIKLKEELQLKIDRTEDSLRKELYQLCFQNVQLAENMMIPRRIN